ncbi:MAG: AbrB/MazE/SpoVT family DNA-binding domain-containing protein, partial [Microcystis aeruginosa F13-15]|nr:AbrB/MazE/SpoVT family DNA-binding domain-containing protein [Microcystis aeruginosa F13-15]NCS31271.1 AbrB/MazE/SpoVT family DNA-binding domain-containing protein [Microcystis aeruginosa F13-15]
MLLKIIQIGNSQGITIPQAIMEQCELTDEVEAIV